ncbi:MAG: leucyl aminopeptidase [Solirubrobacteraceae bacterium]|jgi:leucyl aminopeptidase|nr:leucyl aminopeptidase [Solirubrobacteraceae bacterium]
MRASATTDAPAVTSADTIVVGVFAGKGIPHDLDGAPLTALVDSGEARSTFRHLALHHADGQRWLLVGLGDRDELDPERARVAAATVVARARELGTRVLCWELPHKVGDEVAAAITEGTILAGYRFDRYRSRGDDDDEADRPDGIEELIVSAHHDVADAVALGVVGARAQNLARELQDTPANDLTPRALGERAREIQGVEVEVHGRDFLAEQGMGAFLSVAQGSDHEPALIVARYDGGGDGPLLGLVGKAVTHDTGGLSIKPAASMHEMKFDMSGGAAVLGALQAIAALRLPVRVLAVIGATENTINGSATKPGDIVRAMTGTTIEVNNTDAEGRLVLCDCLAYAVAQGAERLVDVATLTGGVVTALGSTYAGLFSTDEDWAAAVTAAGDAAGEIVWRLPLHPEYEEQMKGRYADLTNSEGRKAHPIQGATFLRRFVGDVPWAHLDIAGTSHDTGRAYAAKGGSGWGVRLLLELARAQA